MRNQVNNVLPNTQSSLTSPRGGISVQYTMQQRIEILSANLFSTQIIAPRGERHNPSSIQLVLRQTGQHLAARIKLQDTKSPTAPDCFSTKPILLDMMLDGSWIEANASATCLSGQSLLWLSLGLMSGLWLSLGLHWGNRVSHEDCDGA